MTYTKEDILKLGGLQNLTNYKVFKRRTPVSYHFTHTMSIYQPTELVSWHIKLVPKETTNNTKEMRSGNNGESRYKLVLCGCTSANQLVETEVLDVESTRIVFARNGVYKVVGKMAIKDGCFGKFERGFPGDWRCIVEEEIDRVCRLNENRDIDEVQEYKGNGDGEYEGVDVLSKPNYINTSKKVDEEYVGVLRKPDHINISKKVDGEFEGADVLSKLNYININNLECDENIKEKKKNGNYTINVSEKKLVQDIIKNKDKEEKVLEINRYRNSGMVVDSDMDDIKPPTAWYKQKSDLQKRGVEKGKYIQKKQTVSDYINNNTIFKIKDKINKEYQEITDNPRNLNKKYENEVLDIINIDKNECLKENLTEKTIINKKENPNIYDLELNDNEIENNLVNCSLHDSKKDIANDKFKFSEVDNNFNNNEFDLYKRLSVKTGERRNLERQTKNIINELDKEKKPTFNLKNENDKEKIEHISEKDNLDTSKKINKDNFNKQEVNINKNTESEEKLLILENIINKRDHIINLEGNVSNDITRELDALKNYSIQDQSINTLYNKNNQLGISENKEKSNQRNYLTNKNNQSGILDNNEKTNKKNNKIGILENKEEIKQKHNQSEIFDNEEMINRKHNQFGILENEEMNNITPKKQYKEIFENIKKSNDCNKNNKKHFHDISKTSNLFEEGENIKSEILGTNNNLHSKINSDILSSYNKEEKNQNETYKINNSPGIENTFLNNNINQNNLLSNLEVSDCNIDLISEFEKYVLNNSNEENKSKNIKLKKNKKDAESCNKSLLSKSSKRNGKSGSKNVNLSSLSTNKVSYKKLMENEDKKALDQDILKDDSLFGLPITSSLNKDSSINNIDQEDNRKSSIESKNNIQSANKSKKSLFNCKDDSSNFDASINNKNDTAMLLDKDDKSTLSDIFQFGTNEKFEDTSESNHSIMSKKLSVRETNHNNSLNLTLKNDRKLFNSTLLTGKIMQDEILAEKKKIGSTNNSVHTNKACTITPKNDNSMHIDNDIDMAYININQEMDNSDIIRSQSKCSKDKEIVQSYKNKDDVQNNNNQVEMKKIRKSSLNSVYNESNNKEENSYAKNFYNESNIKEENSYAKKKNSKNINDSMDILEQITTNASIKAKKNSKNINDSMDILEQTTTNASIKTKKIKKLETKENIENRQNNYLDEIRKMSNETKQELFKDIDSSKKNSMQNKRKQQFNKTLDTSVKGENISSISDLGSNNRSISQKKGSNKRRRISFKVPKNFIVKTEQSIVRNMSSSGRRIFKGDEEN